MLFPPPQTSFSIPPSAFFEFNVALLFGSFASRPEQFSSLSLGFPLFSGAPSFFRTPGFFSSLPSTEVSFLLLYPFPFCSVSSLRSPVYPRLRPLFISVYFSIAGRRCSPSFGFLMSAFAPRENPNTTHWRLLTKNFDVPFPTFFSDCCSSNKTPLVESIGFCALLVFFDFRFWNRRHVVLLWGFTFFSCADLGRFFSESTGLSTFFPRT